MAGGTGPAAEECIYLDHAATAYPRHPRVVDAVIAALGVAGSAGRGGHAGAEKGKAIVADCRAALAALFGAPDPERVLLFPSSTAALSTIIYSLVPPGNPERRRLLIGALEHNAVRRPAVQRFGEERMASLPADREGRVDLERLDEDDARGAAAVILQHASNVNGMVQPIAEVGAWCVARALRFFVDGAQAAGLVPVAFDRVPGLTAYTTAAHKYLGGPPGIGCAWFAPGFDPEPLWIGGNGVDSHLPRVPAAGPARYESGTPNLPGIAGLLAAVEGFRELPVAARWRALRAVRAEWRAMLAAIAGVELIGEGGDAPRTPVISLRIPGWDPAELAAYLDRQIGARCRAGLHCAPLAHEHFGTLPAGTLRIAPGSESGSDAMAKVEGALAAAVRAGI